MGVSSVSIVGGGRGKVRKIPHPAKVGATWWKAERDSKLRPPRHRAVTGRAKQLKTQEEA